MRDRQVELDYVFDRLGEGHLAQAYRLLVPAEPANDFETPWFWI